MEQQRTNMQSVQGKLCVALYEQFGEAVLPVIREVYAAYGREIGAGLAAKWNVKTPSQVITAFIAMCNQAGYPAELTIEGDTARWTGHACPFGLANTHRAVCEAMMAMDQGIFAALLNRPPEDMEFVIEKTLAAGDPECHGIFRARKGSF
ncbi:MAG: hypothetical protein AB1921_12315 [Thermodesulfobacteriota bacterium]